MKVKFISNQPYLYLSNCQIPNYPVTMLNRNKGAQFIHGEFETDDETLIAGLREFIRIHRMECPIEEHDERAGKETLLEELKREPIKPVMTYEEKELHERFMAILRPIGQ